VLSQLLTPSHHICVLMAIKTIWQWVAAIAAHPSQHSNSTQTILPSTPPICYQRATTAPSTAPLMHPQTGPQTYPQHPRCAFKNTFNVPSNVPSTAPSNVPSTMPSMCFQMHPQSCP
jgi:hypothetical protein